MPTKGVGSNSLDPNDTEYWTKFRLLTRQAFLLDDVKLSESDYPDAVKELVLKSRLTIMEINERDDTRLEQCKAGETSDYSDDECESSMSDDDFHDRLEDYEDWHYNRSPVVDILTADEDFRTVRNSENNDGHGPTFRTGNEDKIDLCSEPGDRAKLDLSTTEAVVKVDIFGVDYVTNGDITVNRRDSALEETGQSIMNMDTNEISINRIVGFAWNDGGTDVEDELPTPASSPGHIVIPAIPPAGTDDPFGRGENFDLDLAKVICEVSVLPSLVTPLVDSETSDCATVADYAPPAVPPVESVLNLPSCSVPEDLGCSWIPEFVPESEADNTDEGGFLQLLREPLAPLTVTPPTSPMVTDTSTPSEVPNSCGRDSMPVPSVSPVVTERVVTAEPGPDSSEADHDPGQSPIVMDSMAGCQYRMTSYEERMNDSDMDPSYRIHMHDPRVIEYMGAPESARLLGRTPEYWLEHMGRERTIQAALRLHHDASLIMTNIQIMSQLATSFSRTASEVMRTVHDREPFPTDAVDLVTPGR